MNLYLEISDCSTQNYLYEAKQNLVDLMAIEIATRRQEHDIRSRIESHEGYAREALDAGNDSLAEEIAYEITRMESKLDRQSKLNALHYAEVRRLKDIVCCVEARLYGSDNNSLQYRLDYLEAQAELAEGAENRALERKMFAAGIGRHFEYFETGQQILERIRTGQNNIS